MPRLLKLISDRKAKSKSYSTPPLGHSWKRRAANLGKDGTSSGTSSAGSHTTEETARLKRSHEQWGEEESETSGSSIGIPRTEDIELAMRDPFDVVRYGEFLDQRLNVDFAPPKFSFR